MLPVVIENLAVALTGLTLLVYLGMGLSAWLPPSVSGFRWLIAPWAGYCLLVVVTQFLTNSPLALTSLQSAYVGLGLATLFNAWSLWRSRSAGEDGSSRQRFNPREVWPIALLALAVFVLAVLPLWSYGYTTVIGENWDAEIYMGLGEYLKVYPQAALSHAAPNPILDTLVNPPYSLRTHGFSYFQAALGFLPLDSLHTLAPLLALIRALSIPAAYLFFRLVLGLRARAALLACGVLGLNAFLLWITYNTFGMQVPAFGLLPLAVCLTLLALRTAVDGERLFAPRSAVWWAGLVLAATAITYHPALTAYLALAGPVVLSALLTNRVRAAWGRVLLTSVGIGIVGVVLSTVSQLKSFEGFLKQYSEKIGGLGLTGFTSPGDALGFSLSFRDLLPVDPGRPLMSLLARGYTGWGWVALVVALGLAAYYLWRLRSASRRAAWEQAALALGAVVYVFLFLRPLNYPYGWFKALSFVSFVPLGLSVAGLVWLFQVNPLGEVQHFAKAVAPEKRRLGRAALPAATAGFVMLVPILTTLWLTVGLYWGNPLRFDLSMLEAGAVRPLVTASSDKSVYISNSPNMQKLGRLYNGLLSYFLRDTDLYGDFQTANSKLDRLRPNGLYQYSLLHNDDMPSEYGLASSELVWHNSLMSLYTSPVGANSVDLYHHNFREEGKYPTILEGQTVRFSVTPDSLEFKNVDLPGEGGVKADPLQFSLGLAALITSTVNIEYKDKASTSHIMSVVVPPGYTIYRSPGDVVPPVAAVVSLDMSASGSGSAVYVRWAHLEKYEARSGQEPGISSDGSGLLATISSSQEGSNILVNASYLNNRPESATLTQTLSLDIYGSSSPSIHYGYWNFDVPAGRASRLSLQLDPTHSSLASANLDDKAVRPSKSFAGNTGDGRYTASLLVYENGQVAETFNDIFTFTISGGKLSDFRPRNLPPLLR